MCKNLVFSVPCSTVKHVGEVRALACGSPDLARWLLQQAEVEAGGSSPWCCMENPWKIPSQNGSGWWFGTFFIFPYIGNNHPHWLSYFSEGFKPQPGMILVYFADTIAILGQLHWWKYLEKTGTKMKRSNTGVFDLGGKGLTLLWSGLQNVRLLTHFREDQLGQAFWFAKTWKDNATWPHGQGESDGISNLLRSKVQFVFGSAKWCHK